MELKRAQSGDGVPVEPARAFAVGSDEAKQEAASERKRGQDTFEPFNEAKGTRPPSPLPQGIVGIKGRNFLRLRVLAVFSGEHGPQVPTDRVSALNTG